MAKTWATFCCPGTYKNNYQLCCGIKVDKALFDQVMTLLPVLSKLIPSDSDNEMIALIQPILEQIPSVWAKTTKFDVSLKLEK